MKESTSFKSNTNKTNTLIVGGTEGWCVNELSARRVDIVPLFSGYCEDLPNSVTIGTFKSIEDCLSFIKKFTDYLTVTIRRFDLSVTSNFHSNVEMLIDKEDKTLAGILEEKVNSSIEFISIDRGYCVLYFGFKEDLTLETGWLSSDPSEYQDLIEETELLVRKLNLSKVIIRTSTLCNKECAIKLQEQLLLGNSKKTEDEIHRINKELDSISTLKKIVIKESKVL